MRRCSQVSLAGPDCWSKAIRARSNTPVGDFHAPQPCAPGSRPETVNDLLTQHGYTGEVDLLSVDVDGVDYWVWQAITVCSARLVMLEYNSMFGPDRAVTVPYDPKFNRRDHRFCYYGASLAAMTQLSATKGYRLVAVEPTGVNAFFLRNDVAPEIPACDPAHVYRIPDKYNELIREKQLDVFKWARESGRELVDVG